MYEVRIVRVNAIDTAHLMRYTTRDGVVTVADNNAIGITLLQVLVSQGPHRYAALFVVFCSAVPDTGPSAHNFSLHAKAFFDKKSRFRLSSPGIEGWKGFFQYVIRHVTQVSSHPFLF